MNGSPTPATQCSSVRFDRMLIAQAKAAELRFVTADEAAAAYGDFVLLVR